MVKMRGFEEEIYGYPRLHIENTEDIYDVLDEFDVLISDYSSVMFDFLLSQRPVIYAWFDLDDYYEKEGFFYAPDDISAGVAVKDWLELEKEIKKNVDNGASSEASREAIYYRFNEFHCSDNAGKLCSLIEEVISEGCSRHCFAIY
jgi:CDP-glycerol glycerophosphotransferase (TagB/SpsB family)